MPLVVLPRSQPSAPFLGTEWRIALAVFLLAGVLVVAGVFRLLPTKGRLQALAVRYEKCLQAVAVALAALLTRVESVSAEVALWTIAAAATCCAVLSLRPPRRRDWIRLPPNKLGIPSFGFVHATAGFGATRVVVSTDDGWYRLTRTFAGDYVDAVEVTEESVHASTWPTYVPKPKATSTTPPHSSSLSSSLPAVSAPACAPPTVPPSASV